jgi:hypothetical protein
VVEHAESARVSIERALEAPGDVGAQLRGVGLARALDEAADNVEAALERMRWVLHGAR